MKKKICVCLGIIITLLFILPFCFIGSVKKTPITPEKFTSILNSNGIETRDESAYLDENSKQVILRAINANNIASFAKCHNLKSARWLFDDYSNRIYYANKQAGNTTFNDNLEFSNNHYQYKSYSTSSGYFVVIQVEDTVAQFVVNNKVKDKANNIIKELGYDIGFDINILSAPMMITGILATLLSLVYIILIFKNNNINPILALVPFVNFYFICKIADKNGWKMLFFLIPFFNFLYYFILMYKLAKKYTDSKLICFGLGFLPLVLLPVIAFDKPKIEEKPKNAYEEILKEEGIE